MWFMMMIITIVIKPTMGWDTFYFYGVTCDFVLITGIFWAITVLLVAYGSGSKISCASCLCFHWSILETYCKLQRAMKTAFVCRDVLSLGLIIFICSRPWRPWGSFRTRIAHIAGSACTVPLHQWHVLRAAFMSEPRKRVIDGSRTSRAGCDKTWLLKCCLLNMCIYIIIYTALGKSTWNCHI